jgi:hypothetical protein
MRSTSWREAYFGVEIRDRDPGAALKLPAEQRLRAGHWAGHANQDFSPAVVALPIWAGSGVSWYGSPQVWSWLQAEV